MNNRLLKFFFIISVLGFGSWLTSSSIMPNDQSQYSHTPALWRDHFNAAYDRSRDQIILYGGNRNGEWLEDAWIGKPGFWTQIAGQTPKGRSSEVMLYDPVRQETLLFGGLAKGGKV